MRWGGQLQAEARREETITRNPTTNFRPFGLLIKSSRQLDVCSHFSLSHPPRADFNFTSSPPDDDDIIIMSSVFRSPFLSLSLSLSLWSVSYIGN
jgi:hypothetical protein